MLIDDIMCNRHCHLRMHIPSIAWYLTLIPEIIIEEVGCPVIGKSNGVAIYTCTS